MYKKCIKVLIRFICIIKNKKNHLTLLVSQFSMHNERGDYFVVLNSFYKIEGIQMKLHKI